MSHEQPKFLFDECALGAPAVDALKKLLEFAEPESSALLQHKLTFHGHGPGVWDEVWIPEAAKEGWIVVSSDRGKRGGKKKGEKLPRVCIAHGVTHILLSGKMMKRKQFDKVLSILSVWYDLLDTADAAPGNRFMLEISSRGRAVLTKRFPGRQSLARPRRATCSSLSTSYPCQQHTLRTLPKKKPRFPPFSTWHIPEFTTTKAWLLGRSAPGLLR